MRAIVPIIAIVAVIVMVMTLIFPEQLRGASSNGTLAFFIQATMAAVLAGTGLFGRSDEGRIGLRDGLRYGAIWIGIGLFLVAGYSQRDGFIRLWSSISGEINPSSALSAGESVTLRKSADGHFWAEVTLNGQAIRMMVDTGASDISLDPADAARIGLNPVSLDYNIQTLTAAGLSKAAAVKLDTVALGTITRSDVPATVMVADGGVSLLGMAFLSQLSQISLEGDTLTLRE